MKKILLNSNFKMYSGLLNPEITPELDSLKFDIEMPVGLFEYSDIVVNDLGRIYNSDGPIWHHEEYSTIMRYFQEMSTFRRIKEYYRNFIPQSPNKNLNTKPFLLAYDIRIIGNFFHFIVDFVGRLMALKDYQNYTILLPEQILKNKYDYIQQVISMLNVECYFIRKNTSIKLKKLYAISPVISSPGNQRKDTIKSLRNFYLGGVEPNISGNKAIYISRKNNVRGIKDEKIFIKILIEFGVDIVCPEDFNFKDMVKMMGNYNHLIGVDGAQLTNMLFMQNNSKICSLKHNLGNTYLPSLWFGKYPNLVGNHYYYSMANNLDYKFYNLYCKGDNSDAQWPNQNLVIPQDLVLHLKTFFNY